jgi:hypothetical protein
MRARCLINQVQFAMESADGGQASGLRGVVKHRDVLKRLKPPVPHIGAGLCEIDFDTARAFFSRPPRAIRHDFLPDDRAPAERRSFPLHRSSAATPRGPSSLRRWAPAVVADQPAVLGRDPMRHRPRFRALDASAAGEGDWVRIADENQTFSVQGTQTVRYAAGRAGS